eukprot:TRINITY_DN7063_c0_g1_i1.p1 TRINITY_DN7063_c0_g1~~TRINITY_DN7063_c0_g1_i1.p1  ORF type:complete len:158 (-),score=13.62 TRINITY_DN7063_c0_g1_i1:211-684(-)
MTSSLKSTNKSYFTSKDGLTATPRVASFRNDAKRKNSGRKTSFSLRRKSGSENSGRWKGASLRRGKINSKKMLERDMSPDAKPIPFLNPRHPLEPSRAEVFEDNVTRYFERFGTHNLATSNASLSVSSQSPVENESLSEFMKYRYIPGSATKSVLSS